MIALLCSVPNEADLLLAQAKVYENITLGSKPIYAGMLADQEICLCVGGMGKVNAAHAATLLFTQFRPKVLILFGIGGAYPASGAHVGDIAIAREEIAGDEGVLTLDGFKDTEYISIPLARAAGSNFFNCFPTSEMLLNRAQNAVTRVMDNGRIHTGTFVTLSTCTGTSNRAAQLDTRYHGLCENMEGAAVAQVATLHSLPWLEIRGISNIVEDRDLNKWDIPRAAEAAQKAVIGILEAWDT
jgi:futalosine hydrolase